MRWPLFLLVSAALIIACGETPPLAPTDGSDFAKGGGRPTAGNITVLNLGFTAANDIDEYGRIVGIDQSRTGGIRAILWTPASRRGTTGSAGTLAGQGGDTYALGLNEAGQAAGITTDASATMHAVLWNAGVLQVLGEPGAAASVADDVSDPSTADTRFVVGHTEGPFRAAVWRVSSTGGVSGPEPLPGSESGGQAFAANSAGTLVGDAGTPFTSVPVRWTLLATGAWDPAPGLDLLPGTSHGQAYDVNELGAAVGFNAASVGCSRGVTWAPSSSAAIPLQDLAGGRCSIARAINRAGYISGGALDARGREQAVLWTPLGTGVGYSIMALGGGKGISQGEASGLNEPEVDALGVRTLEVVGSSSGRGTLWKVKLP